MAPERQPGGHPKGRSGRWCAPVPVTHSSVFGHWEFDSLPAHSRPHGAAGQGGSLLRSKRAFESRRADGGAHVHGTTEYSFPVRIWLVLLSKNQSEKLNKRVRHPLSAGALISGRTHGSWPCLVRRWGYFALDSGWYWFESNRRLRPM